MSDYFKALLRGVLTAKLEGEWTKLDEKTQTMLIAVFGSKAELFDDIFGWMGLA